MYTFVRRDRPFNASTIGIGTECLLRYVLEIQPNYEPELPKSPVAILGSLIHRELEVALQSASRDIGAQIRRCGRTHDDYVRRIADRRSRAVRGNSIVLAVAASERRTT